MAQGYRDGYVMAMPRSDHLAAVDSEEKAEGTRVWRKFDRIGGLQVVEVNPGETPAGAIARLRATGRYDFVEPDFLRHACAAPNDPDFAEQWG